MTRSPHAYLVRGARPGDDPIFALNAEATARKAKGEAVINATIGALLADDGSLAVLDTAARAVREVPASEWAPYAPIAGTGGFLDAVLDATLGSHPELRARACAVATPGGTGALRHALSTFLAHGDSVLTTSFYWGPYGTLADEHERKVATFEMFAPGSELRALHVEAFEAALDALLTKQGRSLVFLNDPCHNPTGYSMSDEDWAGVVAAVRKHAARGPIALLLDAAYCDYGPGGLARPLSHLSQLAGEALVLVAWSASKSFTHYGLRVGALAAIGADAAERDALGAALTYACRGTWSNCNRGGMSAIARCLREPALVAKVAEERAALVALLGGRVEAWNAAARGTKLRYPRYDGGFFVTVFTEDAHAAAERLKTAGAFVVPQKGALRVALCSVAAKDVPRLVELAASAIG